MVYESVGRDRTGSGVQEDHRKVLRLETEQGCMSLFRSLTVNLQPNPVVSWEWSVLTLPTAAASSQSSGDDHGAALYLLFFIQGGAKQENHSWIYLGQCSSGRDNPCAPQGSDSSICGRA